VRAQRYLLVFNSIRRILETSGIENLTIANIADISGLHPNTINYYFNGKTDMLMRFHTFMNDNEIRELPSFYHQVPSGSKEAVSSLLKLVDYELFCPVNRPQSFQKIIVHLYGLMDVQPQVKYYLGEKQEERCALLRSSLQLYSSAGIVRPDTLEDGLAAMITTSTGYTLISEYYDTPLMSQNMISERKRIVSLLLDSNHKGLLDKFLS